jgi:hypothetical protein
MLFTPDSGGIGAAKWALRVHACALPAGVLIIG